ncbi:uncharacterized protein LOC111686069 isoform X1 [Lucilia cuprina]|uniref:uncharacterized protein LOC111686069 isoform X1 n=1 Tax=Lucilia cuprina TaxID=7375 RepID=UPI001F052576|nr:uncharacterized protein LOC111686069 isoform X1 [Lucilia cuprina]
MDSRSKFNCQGNWDSKSIKNYSSLEHIKKQLQRSNWSYLCRHPELRAIIRIFLHELINKTPENIHEFSAALFNSNNSPLLVTKINQQLKRVNENFKQSHWSQYDGEMFFSKTDSTHSLLSRTSIGTDVDNMLRYAMIMRDRK